MGDIVKKIHTAFPVWKTIVWGSALWSLLGGLNLIFSVSATDPFVPWARLAVGWARVGAGIFIVISRLYLRRHIRMDTRLFIELGFLVTAAGMRIPLSFRQSQDGHVPWGTTLSITNYVVASVVGLLILWWYLVLPEARREDCEFIHGGG